MTGRKPFEGLKRQVRKDPTRARRVDELKDAMDQILMLAEVRAARNVTQEQLAEALEVTQPNVSRVEHQGDLYLSTLRSYIEALGGELELRAVFEDESVLLDLPAGP